jgi:hypothetical protein
MKKITIISLLILVTFVSSNAQVNYSLPCDSLEQNDSTIILVSGLMDHNELQVNWIKEKIEYDSLENWIKKYLEKQFETELNNDPFILKINNEAIESEIVRCKEFKKYMISDDILVYFTTPKLYWDSLAGQDGLIIIRKCKVIGMLILAQS